jgi:hypothetical protein
LKQIRGTRMLIIFQMKTHLLTSNQSKKYRMYHNMCIGWFGKNEFLTRQNAFLLPQKNLLTD